jgi:co-chaperonin GroES (HSP10)
MIASRNGHARQIPVLNFAPTKDYVLFEELEPGETAGGLAIPHDADMGPPKGLILAVGPGRASEYDPSKRMPMDAKPGKVMYLLGTATKFLLDGKEYGLIRDQHLVAEAPQG